VSHQFQDLLVFNGRSDGSVCREPVAAMRPIPMTGEAGKRDEE
jgi:hypothetical protein